ncbi:MAG: NAD-dependent epimerase/dehydratase family protein [Solirubrobacterales bacterium]|nr:NAD-dependent epimerase/dehydratase family protein [Solirubrobacterales bacterium]
MTGATGFLGAHLVRLLSQRGDEVRVTYRDQGRLEALKDLEIRRSKADISDYRSLKRAFRGSEVVFHTAGYVGSRPTDLAWRINAEAPLLVVEAAAAAGCRRVVVTSSISAVGLAENGQPADEDTNYPKNWLGLTYPDSKHEGERVALRAADRHDVEVVVVNPGYVLGVPLDRHSPREISARTVGNYLRGRLPAVIDAPMNFVDVEDVAAGHLLAADDGDSGQRYILGGQNTTWPALIDRVAELSGVRHPVMVLPREVARLARVRDALGLPGPMAAEGYELMAQDWRFSSDKARRQLGYRHRPLDQTLRATISWYVDLIQRGAFAGSRHSSLSLMATGTRTLGQLGVLAPVKLGQRIVGRRVIAGV